MVVTFDKEYLRELYETGKTTGKKHRFQPEVIDGYIKGIYHLEKAANTEELYKYHSFNYEKLKGNKMDISSIRATKNIE